MRLLRRRAAACEQRDAHRELLRGGVLRGHGGAAGLALPEGLSQHAEAGAFPFSPRAACGAPTARAQRGLRTMRAVSPPRERSGRHSGESTSRAHAFPQQDGATPLLLAAQQGHTECVRVLLAGGADVNCAHEEARPPFNTPCLSRGPLRQLLRFSPLPPTAHSLARYTNPARALRRAPRLCCSPRRRGTPPASRCSWRGAPTPGLAPARAAPAASTWRPVAAFAT